MLRQEFKAALTYNSVSKRGAFGGLMTFAACFHWGSIVFIAKSIAAISFPQLPQTSFYLAAFARERIAFLSQHGGHSRRHQAIAHSLRLQV
jgi:hypothetical protein